MGLVWNSRTSVENEGGKKSLRRGHCWASINTAGGGDFSKGPPTLGHMKKKKGKKESCTWATVLSVTNEKTSLG